MKKIVLKIVFSIMLIALGVNANAQSSYCTFTTNNTGDYITSFETSGGNPDISNLNNGQGTTSQGYSDFTAMSVGVFETQQISLTITEGSGGDHGYSVFIDWDDNQTFDSSEKVWGTTSYESTPQTASFTVPTGQAMGQYRMRVVVDWLSPTPGACSGSYAEAEDYTVDVIATPSCLPPGSLSVSSVTSSSLDLAWVENGTATTWNVEYREVAVGGPYQQISGTTSNPLTITGLNSNTEYEFKVQADCGGGDTSYYSAVYGPVLTECASYLANGLCEGFDINSSPTIGCWRIRDENGDGDYWQVSTQNPNTGAYSAVINTDYNSGDNDDYLISPPLTLTGIEALKFSYAVQSSSEPNDFQVLLSNTGTNIADFTDTLMALADYDNTDYKDTVVDLTMYTGDVYVAFHVPPGGLDGWRLYIDDVCFGECIPTPGQDGNIDVCMLDDHIDLTAGIISNINQFGRWDFPPNQDLVVDDTMFNVGNTAEGTYEVLYIVEGLCEPDTTVATVQVHAPSSAGQDGSKTVCMNQPTNLLSALSGNVDVGGDWYDYTNTLLPTSQPNAPSIPGQFQYSYIANNGYCPSDTSIVTVTVLDTCDYLSIGNEDFTDISIYPNPAKSQLNIVNPSNTADLKVEILDMNGRTVLIENKVLNSATEATLTIDHLENGFYTLRIYNNDGQKTFKVVKQ